jgi:rhamnulokinase
MSPRTDDPLYIAIDLGAGSGRVFLADLSPERFSLEELRRFSYPPSYVDGHLRWDFQKIIDELKTGLQASERRANELGRRIFSIGVDSWGVDYGLIDSAGALIDNPVCYRDQRTQGVMERVFTKVSRDEIFERTGIQFLQFNTLFQLYAQIELEGGIPDRASRMLMIPDLVNLWLTGKAVSEYTNATTTQMLDAASGEWDHELMARLRLPARLCCEVVPAGSDLGLITPSLARELSLEDVRVTATATHDTASAVAGTPMEDDWAYISSGTWSLVGIERDNPLINSEVAKCNFTNEGGAFRSFRFLKNVMGLWILESCRKEWAQNGSTVDYKSLLSEVASIDTSAAIIFPDDPRFLNPPSMLNAISTQLSEFGGTVDFSRQNAACAAKTVLDSLALRYASVIRTIESLTGRKIRGIHIVGGGSRNGYLNQATATAAGLPVKAGPVEATVTGNVLIQAIAAGRFESLAEARRYLGERYQLKEYEPTPSKAWEEAARRYEEIERRYQ